MGLYESIFERKSVRKYDMQPLDNTFQEEMEAAIAGFRPLYPDVPVRHRVISSVKGRFTVAAPHYLVISGSGKAGEKENAGFIYQQLVLWLDTRGIGSVWLGGAKDGAGKEGDDIVVIAFGKPEEALHRTRGEFKRKSIEQVIRADGDIHGEAVQLAPSGMNLQPWFFDMHEDGTTLLYQQKLKGPISLLYKLVDVDMGIALRHYWLAGRQEGKDFAFTREGEAVAPKGYAYFGRITSA